MKLSKAGRNKMIQNATGWIETSKGDPEQNDARKTGRGGAMRSTGGKRHDANMVKHVTGGLPQPFCHGSGGYLAAIGGYK